MTGTASLIMLREFNELVNMSASELEAWLKGKESESSGWSKDDGSGETIGHESCVHFPKQKIKYSNITLAFPVAVRSSRF